MPFDGHPVLKMRKGFQLWSAINLAINFLRHGLLTASVSAFKKISEMLVIVFDLWSCMYEALKTFRM